MPHIPGILAASPSGQAHARAGPVDQIVALAHGYKPPGLACRRDPEVGADEIHPAPDKSLRLGRVVVDIQIRPLPVHIVGGIDDMYQRAAPPRKRRPFRHQVGLTPEALDVPVVHLHGDCNRQATTDRQSACGRRISQCLHLEAPGTEGRRSAGLHER